MYHSVSYSLLLMYLLNLCVTLCNTLCNDHIYNEVKKKDLFLTGFTNAYCLLPVAYCLMPIAFISVFGKEILLSNRNLANS